MKTETSLEIQPVISKPSVCTVEPEFKFTPSVHALCTNGVHPNRTIDYLFRKLEVLEVYFEVSKVRIKGR